MGTIERRRILRDMGQVLARRGPDDEQIYDDGHLSLVFRRLTIVGNAEGQQPLVSESGEQVLVCNGEVFNHEELRREMGGQHRFISSSDCEPLVHGLAESGPDFLAQVNGMFALAFWDRARRKLLLARDRLGIKPLYYALIPGGIVFGSELKALLVHPRCPRSADMRHLGISMMTPLPTPSFVQDVHQLGGGRFLVIDQACRPQIRRFWDIRHHLGTAPFGNNGRSYEEQLRHLLYDSVRRQIVGPQMGLHLSGGTDSTLIAACAAREGRSLPCFSFVERTTLLCGDVDAASQAVDSLGHTWYPVHFDYRSIWNQLGFDLQAMERLVWMMDSPRFDVEWLLKWALTAAAKDQLPDMKVLLLGQGADEFAGGYSNRIDCQFSNWSQYIQEEVQPTLAQFGMSLESGPSGSDLGPYHLYMRLFRHQLQVFNLWHEDRTSSWHGVEARVPFLDHRVVELLASVPAQLHADLFWSKRIYRDVLHELLPQFDARRIKTGFHVTDDTRSIQILQHDLAQRLALDFKQSYVMQDDFPLDRAMVLSSIETVVRRKPGFFTESVRLLEYMCTAIFVRNLQPGAFAAYGASTSQSHATLDLVTNSSWCGLTEDWSKQPVIPLPWHTDDMISVASDPNISHHLQIENGRWVLTVEDEGGESMTLSGSGLWFSDFWSRISGVPGQYLRLGFLVATLEATFEEFTDVLNVLHQCGFIVHRKAAPSSLQPSRQSRVMQMIGQLVRGR